MRERIIDVFISVLIFYVFMIDTFIMANYLVIFFSTNNWNAERQVSCF